MEALGRYQVDLRRPKTGPEVPEDVSDFDNSPQENETKPEQFREDYDDTVETMAEQAVVSGETDPTQYEELLRLDRSLNERAAAANAEGAEAAGGVWEKCKSVLDSYSKLKPWQQVAIGAGIGTLVGTTAGAVALPSIPAYFASLAIVSGTMRLTSNYVKEIPVVGKWAEENPIKYALAFSFVGALTLSATGATNKILDTLQSTFGIPSAEAATLVNTAQESSTAAETLFNVTDKIEASQESYLDALRDLMRNAEGDARKIYESAFDRAQASFATLQDQGDKAAYLDVLRDLMNTEDNDAVDKALRSAYSVVEPPASAATEATKVATETLASITDKIDASQTAYLQSLLDMINDSEGTARTALKTTFDNAKAAFEALPETASQDDYLEVLRDLMRAEQNPEIKDALRNAYDIVDPPTRTK